MVKGMLSQRFFGEGRSDQIEDFAPESVDFGPGKNTLLCISVCVCEDSKPPKVSELSQKPS